MSDQQEERKPLPKTAFNEFKLRLAGPKQEGERNPPSLQAAVIKNNPRFDVFTNISSDRTDNGRISAPMDALTFFAVIMKLEEIALGEPDVQVKIENREGRPGETRLKSHTILGKDKEGRVFISVIAQERPKIKFLFLPSEWHNLAHRDGTPYGEAELTVLYAKAWVKMLSELVPNVMDTHYSPPEPRNNNGGGGYNKGGGGGYNKGGYNKGGYNKGGYNKGGGGNYNNRGGGGGNYNRNNGGGNNYQNRNNGGGGNEPPNVSPGGGDVDFDDDFPM